MQPIDQCSHDYFEKVEGSVINLGTGAINVRCMNCSLAWYMKLSVYNRLVEENEQLEARLNEG